MRRYAFIAALLIAALASRGKAQAVDKGSKANDPASRQTSRDFGRSLTVKPCPGTSVSREIALYKASHALIVGNSDYRGGGWEPLPNAARDADEVAAALNKNGFAVTLKKNLTRSSFDLIFDEFVNGPGKTKDARLLFYYAGHGHTKKISSGEDLGFLVMVDAGSPVNDAVGFRNRSVDMDSLITRAKEIDSVHVLFMFDSCFSGSILNMRDNKIPEAITDNIRYPVREFITAGRANEPVPDKSHFKSCFLDVLEGRYKPHFSSTYVTGEELGLYLKTQVSNYFPKQHPQFGKINDPALDKGDFVFSFGPEQPAAPSGHLTAQERQILESTAGALAKAVNLYCGIGPDKKIDEYESSKLLLELEQQGNVVSQMWIALFMRTKKLQFRMNYTQAAELARKVFDKLPEAAKVPGYDKQALYLLGEAHAYGLGVTEDKQIAIQYFKQAAEIGNGDPLALCRLGELTELDNPKVGMDYYERSARQNCVFGIINLAGCYENKGGQENTDRAINLLQQASNIGSEAARRALKQIKSQAAP